MLLTSKKGNAPIEMKAKPNPLAIDFNISIANHPFRNQEFSCYVNIVRIFRQIINQKKLMDIRKSAYIYLATNMFTSRLIFDVK
jgi:hypothetical protein